MKLKTNLSLLFFISVTLTLFAQQNVLKKQTPAWVNVEAYDTDPAVNQDDIADGYLTLLADYQINIPKQETYYKFAKKITENVGVQSASSINVVYDPSYQKLVFHTIEILRDGETIDKFNAADFQVLKRELNAENYLYDGSLSAITNLSDVRVNDIIAYSFTIIGFNPINKGNYSDSFYLNDNVAIGEINIAIHTAQKLNHKYLNADNIPFTLENENGLKKYRWNIETPEKTVYEEGSPSWTLTHPILLVSTYNDWKEVIDWGVEIFKNSEKPSAELQKKINEIDKSFSTGGEKIKAVLNFVQNEIRYLGFENGIGSYKPNAPNKVFKQRYGDCKDKSLLMVTMLKSMGIKAYPMLLNTTLRHTIQDFLPSHAFFDHCVVKVVDSNDYEFYYDPTVTNQGGTYNNTHFTNYEIGLVLNPNNVAFDTIRSSFTNLIVTEEEYVLEEVGKGASLKIKTTYSDYEADRMRNYFKNNSINAINKEYENYYANYFFDIKSTKNPEYTDDSTKNEFVTLETYKIDSIWSPMENQNTHIAVAFNTTSMFDIFYVPTSEERTQEIALGYPIAREHHIKIKLPEAWNIENDSGLISSDFFYYDYDINYQKSKREVNIKYYLKTQKNTILPSEIKQYNKDLTKLDESLGYMIYIPKSGSSATNLSQGITQNITKIALIVIVGLVVVAVIVLIALKLGK